MKRVFFIIFIISIFLYGANIEINNQKQQSINKNTQKSKEKGYSKEKSKTSSKERGRNIDYAKEKSKSQEIEKSISKEKSLSYSKIKNLKRSVEIKATMLMPEVDFLIKRFIKHYLSKVKTFISQLQPSYYDLPPKWQEYFGYNLLPENRYNVTCEPPKSYTIHIDAVDSNFILCAINTFNKKYQTILPEFFKKYGLKISSSYSIGYAGGDMPMTTSKAVFGESLFSIKFGGNTRGELYISLRGLKSDFTIYNNLFFTQYKPINNSFLMAYKNIPIIILNNNEMLHFYGDLVFKLDILKQSIIVTDKKINADGINLSRNNLHNKFDDYFKKLMKLYLEAFSNLNLNSQENYSIEEIKYKTREYIYKKVKKRNDFFQQYLTNPIDFWRPNKKELQNLPLVNTGFNDIIYSKQDGIILNRTISFQVETENSINRSYNRLIRESKNKKFANTIKKAVSQFERENKTELARLTKQLAIKIVNSKNAEAKMDRIIKQSISTDILKQLLNLTK